MPLPLLVTCSEETNTCEATEGGGALECTNVYGGVRLCGTRPSPVDAIVSARYGPVGVLENQQVLWAPLTDLQPNPLCTACADGCGSLAHVRLFDAPATSAWSSDVGSAGGVSKTLAGNFDSGV